MRKLLRFELAVDEFPHRQRHEQMLERLNEACGNTEPAEKHLLKGMKAKLRPTLKESW